MIAPGIAPIKREFIAKLCSDETSHLSSDGVPGKDRRTHPKHRGMNKNRPKLCTNSESDRLCPSLSLSENITCKFEGQCKFEHDSLTYWKTKPEDLGPICPIFEQRGHCPFSISCRFASAHTTLLDDRLIQQSDCNKVWQPTQNTLSTNLRTSLRKRQYRFDSLEKDHMIGAPLEPSRMRHRDWVGKSYLAPLTTVGNLPFRRICIEQGAEITCGEMAVSTCLLAGKASEWSLHLDVIPRTFANSCLVGGFPDTMTKCAQLLIENTNIDFLDINLGCPLDLINNKGAGCALATRANRLTDVLVGMDKLLDRQTSEDRRIPLTIKLRTGVKQGQQSAHSLIAKLKLHRPPDLITLHGRSKEQRYAKLADWSYVEKCAEIASPIPLFGCGDVLSFDDYYHRLDTGCISGVMIGRGALVKPWIFTEIQQRRHWDISSQERFDILKRFVHFGLDHWGSDTRGVSTTRHFLLEWLSFLHRYIPVGLLEVLPQRINEKPPHYFARDPLETLMASDRASDWLRISEMLLGPVDKTFVFLPKHRANDY